MRKFTYTFLKDKTITASLFFIKHYYRSKRKVATKKKLNKDLFNKLNSIAIKESVVVATLLKVFSTQKRIKEIIEDNSKPLTHSEEEIAGYHDAIRFVTENYEYLDFNEETIKRIHALLVGRHVGFDKGGKYKTSDNVIARTTEGGTIIDVIFVPIKAKDVEKAMKDFCLDYQVARDDYDIPSLLLIPCVIMDFLSIHPFSDGNGRVSRLLTLLLLYKEGYDIGKYISLENQINQYRDSYYHALQRSQKDWYDSKNTYYPFIEFTFQILYQCYKEMNKRIMTIKTGKEKKSEHAAVVLDSIVPLPKILKILQMFQ